MEGGRSFTTFLKSRNCGAVAILEEDFQPAIVIEIG